MALGKDKDLKLRWGLILVALIGVTSSRARAESRGARFRPSSAPLVTEQPAPRSRLTGGVAIRPTWALSGDNFFFENSASLGLKIRDSVELGFNQDFNVVGLATVDGAGELEWRDAFARVRFSDWWKSRDGISAVTTDFRGYFPTHAVKRDRGMLTQIRVGTSVSSKMNDGLSLGFGLTPILHLYDRDSFRNDDGEVEANPLFENRVNFGVTLGLGGGLSLEIPLHYYVTLYADIGETGVNSGVWNHFLGFFPSLNLSLGDHLSLGATYYSGNFISEADYGYTLAEDFAQGSFQVSLSLSL